MKENGVVYTQIRRGVSKQTIDKLREIGAATVHEAMGKLNLVDEEIRPIDTGLSCAGPAITCFTPACDNLMVHRALKLIQHGDVLLINAQGFKKAGLWGELTSIIAQTAGAAGVIIDGAVRDTEKIREMKLPLWSRAIHAGGTDKNAVGAINVPIHFAGVMVYPGDIVVADCDGVVLVPSARADEIAKLAGQREKSETLLKEKLKKGEYFFDLANMNETFEKLGIKEIEGTYDG